MPYDVFSYDGFKKNTTEEVLNPIYYQDSGLSFVKKKFKFQVSHFLNGFNIGEHKAQVYNGFYWPTSFAEFAPIHQTTFYYDTDKAVYDGVQKIYYSYHNVQLLPNATAIDKICEDGLKIKTPEPPFRNVKEIGVFDDETIKCLGIPAPPPYMDFPDYPFYNYSYITNYQVVDITLATPANARIFYQQNIKKIDTKRYAGLEEQYTSMY